MTNLSFSLLTTGHRWRSRLKLTYNNTGETSKQCQRQEQEDPGTTTGIAISVTANPLHSLVVDDNLDRCSLGSHSSCASPVSSQGGIYSVLFYIQLQTHSWILSFAFPARYYNVSYYLGEKMELLETYGLNLHRIDKDVLRCDRNYHFFTPVNLEKLRNIMCTYVKRIAIHKYRL